MTLETKLDRVVRQLPRFTLKYPDFVTKEYGGKSQGFRVAHRRKLRAAAKALAEAFRGCAWAGDFEQLDMAQHAVRKAIEMCKPANWEHAKNGK